MARIDVDSYNRTATCTCGWKSRDIDSAKALAHAIQDHALTHPRPQLPAPRRAD